MSLKHDTLMSTTGRQPFNVFFISTGPRHIASKGTHQRSFYSKTDNTKVDCHRQQSTQTFFNIRKPKKTTNVRKPKWNERQTTKQMWRPSISRQATPSRLKSPCCSEGANPKRSSNQIASTRRAPLSVAAKAVKPADFLNPCQDLSQRWLDKIRKAFSS